MAVYIVGQINITDAEMFKIYSEKVAPTVHEYGGRYLVRGGSREGGRKLFRRSYGSDRVRFGRRR